MRNHYLQHMGITVWHLREASNALCLDYFECVLKNSAGKTGGLIVSKVDHKVALSEQESLLKKIAASLNGLENKITQKRGKVPACEPTMNFVLNITLSDLLRNPENKKKLWAQMKPLKKYF
ncbi:MAG: hypothetical protein A3E82_06905 [Gammaproteobacteria bacterium RIFCSPHIGHO2_12_FULL_38_11]|nr:MAG: hypothetical protein A3E82_06905 [Gammaproteobacteria bacterium RIFCSPHIGHO2_12_FULL_38_11]